MAARPQRSTGTRCAVARCERYPSNRIWGSGSRLAAAGNDRGAGEPQGLEGQLEGHPQRRCS